MHIQERFPLADAATLKDHLIDRITVTGGFMQGDLLGPNEHVDITLYFESGREYRIRLGPDDAGRLVDGLERVLTRIEKQRAAFEARNR
jgi:hypothetical protein